MIIQKLIEAKQLVEEAKAELKAEVDYEELVSELEEVSVALETGLVELDN